MRSGSRSGWKRSATCAISSNGGGSRGRCFPAICGSFYLCCLQRSSAAHSLHPPFRNLLCPCATGSISRRLHKKPGPLPENWATTRKLIDECRMIIRSAYNSAGIAIANAKQIREGDTILMVYGGGYGKKPYRPMFSCTVVAAPIPVPGFEGFSYADSTQHDSLQKFSRGNEAMQDRYFGDVGDFGKFGLLRVLVGQNDASPLRLGVVCRLVSGAR